MSHTASHAVTDAVSHNRGTLLVTHVQNQNQNQTVVKAAFGVCGQGSIHRLGSDATGRDAWMALRANRLGAK